LLQGEISSWPPGELAGFVLAQLQYLDNRDLGLVVDVAMALSLRRAMSGPLIALFPGNIAGDGWRYPYKR
jgi:hypothetical protein